MRLLLLSAVLLSVAAVVLGGGARFPTFSQTSPLPSITLEPKYETLPEETLPTKFLPDVVNTKVNPDLHPLPTPLTLSFQSPVPRPVS